MKSPIILIRYLSRAFAFALVVALVVLSFIMSLGVIFKITDLLAKGAALSAVLHIFLNGIPAGMMFAIPMSTLVASLLLFGRLSADGEITAMRVSGLSFGQIMRGPLLVSGVVTVFCFYVNGVLAPTCHKQQWTTIRELAAQSPMDLLEVGRYLKDFPGLSMYIASKENNTLKDVRILTQTESGMRQEIFAKEGRVSVADNKKDIVIDLRTVTIDPISEELKGSSHSAGLQYKIPNALSSGNYKLKLTDYTIGQLLSPEAVAEELNIDIPRVNLELHKRLVLTLSAFSFAFLGIPLGVRSHRKESSIGVAISLILVVNFYLFIMIAESLVKIPHSHPEIIMWMPVVISLGFGSWLIRRAR